MKTLFLISSISVALSGCYSTTCDNNFCAIETTPVLVSTYNVPTIQLTPTYVTPTYLTPVVYTTSPVVYPTTPIVAQSPRGMPVTGLDTGMDYY